jgi:nucleolar protein 56
MELVTTWFGTFLCDNNKIVKFILFPQDAHEIAVRLYAIEDNKVLDEEKQLIEGIDEFFVTENRLQAIGGKLMDISKASRIDPNQFGVSDTLFHRATIELGKIKLSKSVTPDMPIIQAINLLDDLHITANLLAERLREWYGMYLPDLATEIEDEREYARLIRDFCEPDAILEHIAQQEVDVSSLSAGYVSELSEHDKRALIELATLLTTMYYTIDKIERYVQNRCSAIAPNLSRLAGPVIGARLIALTGGLERLAKIPASTIQLLGAEKALFRHLRDGSAPPKHGVIYQHPSIHQASSWQRGKLARALASKIAIAARADYTTNNVIADDLKSKYNSRVEEIKTRYRSGPPVLSARKRKRTKKKQK